MPTPKEKGIKKWKLDFIDKIDNTVNCYLEFCNKKDIGYVSDEYIKGYNSALSCMHYNIGLERKFVEVDVTCGYDYQKKLNVTKLKILPTHKGVKRIKK